MRCLSSLKCSETTVKLTKILTTGKTAPHSWNCYVATNVSDNHAVIIEDLWCFGTPHLAVT